MGRKLYYVIKANPTKHIADRIGPGCIEENILMKGQDKTVMIGVALSAGEVQTDLEKAKAFPLFQMSTGIAPFDRYVSPCENPQEYDEVIATVQLRPDATLFQLEQAENLEAIFALCENYDTG